MSRMKDKRFHGTNKPKRRIRWRTKKEKEEDRNKLYLILRKDFLRNHPFCEVKRVRDGINERATEIHHRRGRGRFLLKVETWIPVSKEGHLWIHQNQGEARKLGLIC